MKERLGGTSLITDMITLGIDVGGTFTDLVMRDARTGEMRTLKTPTTPPSYADGVLNAIRMTKAAAADIAGIAHGMTVATNTALEMNGARLGVITTRGFRDVLIVGRGNRTSLYDIKAVRPPPLVERARVLEVDEHGVDCRWHWLLQQDLPNELEAPHAKAVELRGGELLE